MPTDTRPVAFTVERIINHIYMMYPTVSRQEVTQRVKGVIIGGKASFRNSFQEPVQLVYDDTWLVLTDETLYCERRFLLPRPLANIYLYGTLDRYQYFNPAPFRVDEKGPHRCRRVCPFAQEELVNDIEEYFGVERDKLNVILTSLLFVKKTFNFESDRFHVDFVVDDLSWPALSVTRLNYGHLNAAEPRKKYTHYDLRKVIDFMRYSRKP